MERHRHVCPTRAILALLAILCSRWVLVSAQLMTLAIPISSQLACPARIGQEFDFTFSPSTFVPVDNQTVTKPLLYSASPLPDWLTFDSATRSFHGKPSSEDEGIASIGVTAYGALGQAVGTDRFDLAITTRQGNIELTVPLTDQLTAGDEKPKSITSAFPYPSDSPFYPGVRVPPNWSFSLGFQSRTYTIPTGAKVFYSASMVDGSPLPDWLYFNNGSVTFDGVAPGFEKVTTFQVVLAGGDVLGYRDISQSFNITISPRDFTAVAQDKRKSISITADGDMVDVGITSAVVANLRLDGEPIKSEDLASMELDLETTKVEGLRYISSNSSLAGSVDKGMVDKTVSVPLHVVNRFGDILNTTLDINFVASSFKDFKLPPSILTPGQEYKVDLDDYLANTKDPVNLTATYEPSSASSFVSLNNDHELSGRVPTDLEYKSVMVHLLAVSGKTNATSRSEIMLSLTGNGTEPATLAAHPSLPTGAIVAIAVISSIAGAILLLGLVLLLLRKLRKRKTEDKGIGHKAGQGGSADELERGVWIHQTNDSPGVNGGAKEEIDQSDKHSLSPSMTVENGSGVGVGENTYPRKLDRGPPVPQSPHPASIPLPSSPTGLQLGFWARLNPFARGKGLHRRFSGVKISNPIVTPDFGNAAYQAQLAHAVSLKGVFQRRTAAAASNAAAAASSESPAGLSTTTPISMENDTNDTNDTPKSNGATLNSGARSSEVKRRMRRSVSPVGSGFTGKGTQSATSSQYPCSSDRSDSRGCDSPVSEACFECHRGPGPGEDNDIDNETDLHESCDHHHHRHTVNRGRRDTEWQDGEEDGDHDDDRDSIDRTLDTSAIVYDSDDNAPAEWLTHRSAGNRPSPRPSIPHSDFTGTSSEQYHSNPHHHALYPPRPQHYRESDEEDDDDNDDEQDDGEMESRSVEVPTHRPVNVPRNEHTVVTPSAEISEDDLEISIDNIHFPTESDLTGTNSSFDNALLEEAVIETASKVYARSASARSTLESPVTMFNRSPSPSSDASGVTERGRTTMAMETPQSEHVPSRLVNFNNQRIVQVTPLNVETDGGVRNVSHTAIIHHTRSVTETETGSATDNGSVGGIDQSPDLGRQKQTSIPGTGTGASISVVSPLKEAAEITEITDFTVGANDRGKGRPRRKTLLNNVNVNEIRTPTPTSASASSTRQPLAPTDTNTPSPTALPSLPSVPNIEKLLARPASHKILLGVEEPFHFYPPLNLIVSGRISLSGKPDTKPGATYTAVVEDRSFGKGGKTELVDLPNWLRFEDMELWGVPEPEAKGDWTLRIVENMNGVERAVGRFTLEVSSPRPGNGGLF